MLVGRASFGNCGADKDHRKNREDVGLDRAGQQIESHERNRYQEACQREYDSYNEHAAHDVAEQSDNERERARNLLDEIQWNHDPARFGESGQIAAESASSD